MGWSYSCAKEEHSQCYDTKKDTYSCDCPCHLMKKNRAKYARREIEERRRRANVHY